MDHKKKKRNVTKTSFNEIIYRFCFLFSSPNTNPKSIILIVDDDYDDDYKQIFTYASNFLENQTKMKIPRIDEVQFVFPHGENKLYQFACKKIYIYVIF